MGGGTGRADYGGRGSELTSEGQEGVLRDRRDWVDFWRASLVAKGSFSLLKGVCPGTVAR